MTAEMPVAKQEDVSMEAVVSEPEAIKREAGRAAVMETVKQEDLQPFPEDDVLPLKQQGLKLSQDIKTFKPSPKDVIVLAFGSYAIRYGFASDSTPSMIYPAVAFPRRDKSIPPFRIPHYTKREPADFENAKRRFEDTRLDISQELSLAERRRGGGRPIPWKAAVEYVPEESSEQKRAPLPTGKVLVGRDVELLLLDEERAQHYDIIKPLWNGKLLLDCGAPVTLIRKALDALLSEIVKRLDHDRKHGKRKVSKLKDSDSDKNESPVNTDLFLKDGMAKAFVTVVVPETSQRRDVSELVDAIFMSNAMQTAALFIHQSAVSCALGAGLATCTVVDIGHSATTIACVEDAVVCGESRIHLEYGSLSIQHAFDYMLAEYSNLNDLVNRNADGTTRAIGEITDEISAVVAKAAEQMGGFNVEENDTMNVALIRTPSGRALRVKLGVGLRSLPCYGLIYPTLLHAAELIKTNEKNVPKRGLHQKNSEDDNYVSDIFNDLRRSGIATAALPIGTFANDPGQPAASRVDSKEASIVDAIIWSIARAVEIKRPDQQARTPDHYRRYLNAIVLAGGGASIDGIALALESRIKKGFLDAGVSISDVTVIDGGKGKGDEELAAAAAVLKDVDSEGGIIDDTDTASLPWKGGAVMVEADSVQEYWIYRDDWDAKNVRALRERAPFYW